MNAQNPKSLSLFAFALTALVSTHAFAAGGTRGGNGDLTDPVSKSELAQEKTEAGVMKMPPLFIIGRRQPTGNGDVAIKLSPEAVAAQTRSSEQVDELDQWCDRIITFLNRWERRATIQAGSGRFGLANQLMESAFDQAIDKIKMEPGLASPLTLRLIERGKEISVMLDQEIKPTDPMGLESKYRFLNAYLTFVIKESNSVELDQKLVVPYYYRFGECLGGCPAEFSLENFEARYLEVAAKALEFPVKHFTHVGLRDGEETYKIVGNPKVFLNAAQIIAQGVADDVKATLYRYAEACTIVDLTTLSDTLKALIHHDDHQDFTDAGDAIDKVSKQLKEYSKKLTDGLCRGNVR